jgi:hypothetical protein
MQVKMYEVRGILEAIGKCAGMNLPTKIAYGFARTVLDLQPELQIFEEERLKIGRKYAKLDSKGAPKTEEVAGPVVAGQPVMQNQLVFKDDKARSAFIADVAEFGKTDVEIKLREPFSLDQFNDPNTEDEALIAWDVVAGLMPILKDPDEGK